MKFQNDMIKIQHDLADKGYIVILPVIRLSVNDLTDDQKVLYLNIHYRKIDMCDILYIINKNGYIGESTRQEIEYALKHNKEIIYLEN